LIRFFSPTKFISAKTEITTFRQGTDETLYEVWKRFKSLLRCPNHNISVAEQLNIFCNGLIPDIRMVLDVAVSESMMAIDADRAYRIINAFATTDRMRQQDRRLVQKKVMPELNTIDAMLAQNKLISQKIEELTKQLLNLPMHSVNNVQNHQV
jgi:hypothetical protein